MAKTKKTGLGKGAAALFGNIDSFLGNDEPEVVAQKQEILGSVNEIPIDNIEVNPFQPRTEFDPDRLNELMMSIETFGIIQPITVRSMGDGRFQLISGERRLRAATKAGLTSIPAYVRLANDQEMLEIALLENIQREDLNAIEVGLTYKRLLDEVQMTHDQLATRLGKNRTTITNFIRLLNLPPEIQMGLKGKKITMGHARALLGSDDLTVQLLVYKKILNEGLSVRKVEQLIKAYKNPETTGGNTNVEVLTPAYREVVDNLAAHFETKIQFKLAKNGKGNISIPFTSVEDLNRLLEIIYND